MTVKVETDVSFFGGRWATRMFSFRSGLIVGETGVTVRLFFLKGVGEREGLDYKAEGFCMLLFM